MPTLTMLAERRNYAAALARQEGVERVAVELHFLQTAEVVRVAFDAAALQKARSHLGASASALTDAWRERAFPPRPAVWRCRRCDFRTICDEGQAVAAPEPAAPTVLSAEPDPVAAPPGPPD